MKRLISKVLSHVSVFYRRFKYTCENLTVHGPSFLVRTDIHWIYRLIYFVIYIQVWFSAMTTIMKYYNHYQSNTIRFTTRTDYLEWNTTFPSLTVCEMLNVEKIAAISQQNGESNEMDQFYGEIAFYTGTCYSCLSICEREQNCTNSFTTVNSKFRTPCEDFFLSCKWLDEPINCCKHFKSLETEYGTCYSINSRNVQEKQTVYNNMASTKKRQKGSLEITASQDYEAFLHSPDDVPFWNMEYDRRITVAYGSDAFMKFSIMDVVNEPEVAMTDPAVRECRFSHEIPDNYLAYTHYSYSVCITQCRIEAQLKLCNCTHHHSPRVYEDRYCDMAGLQCLTNNFKHLRKLKVPYLNDTGLECECLPSCTEPDYNVVAKKLEKPKKDLQAGSAVFTLANRPYQRLTRQVSRTTLDLVVAMGNTFSLCFGGSLLSLVEVAYYLCFKRWKYDSKGN